MYYCHYFFVKEQAEYYNIKMVILFLNSNCLKQLVVLEWTFPW